MYPLLILSLQPLLQQLFPLSILFGLILFTAKTYYISSVYVPQITAVRTERLVEDHIFGHSLYVIYIALISCDYGLFRFNKLEIITLVLGSSKMKV